MCLEVPQAAKNATRSFKYRPFASGVTPSSSAGWFWRLTRKVGYSNDFAPAASHPAKVATGFGPASTKSVRAHVISARIRFVDLDAISAQHMIKHAVQLRVTDSGLLHHGII
jgi:hypothetical protein